MLKDRPTSHKNMVSQDRLSLVTDSIVLKCGTFCQEYMVLQDRLSLIAAVSQDRFHCTHRDWHLFVPVYIYETVCLIISLNENLFSTR